MSAHQQNLVGLLGSLDFKYDFLELASGIEYFLRTISKLCFLFPLLHL